MTAAAPSDRPKLEVADAIRSLANHGSLRFVPLSCGGNTIGFGDQRCQR